MPNRILRDSIRTSASLSLLTSEEERHFYRLIVFADDFGRFDARPQVIKGFCYSLLEDVNVQQVAEWTNRLSAEDVAILQLYEVEHLQFGRFINWNKYQKTRAKESKYPEPPTSANICLQVPTNVPVIEDVIVIEVEDVVVVQTGADAPASANIDDEIWPEWFALLYGVKGVKTGLAEAEAWRTKNDITEALAEEKAYALRDWWPRQPPSRTKGGNPYSTWQHWCKRDRQPGGTDNGKSPSSGTPPGWFAEDGTYLGNPQGAHRQGKNTGNEGTGRSPGPGRDPPP